MLEVKFVSYGRLFTIQQEVVQIVEQKPLKKKSIIVGCFPRGKVTMTCG